MNSKVIVVPPFLALFAAFGVALQSDQSIRPGFGAVAGQVIDAQTKKPVAAATVVAERDDAQGPSKVPHAFTDEEGQFFINDVPPGKYVIAASKEQDNYPDADSAAFAADLAALPKVSIQEGQVTRGVVVPVEKGGKLIGVILDSKTRKPIVSSLIRLSRVDNTKLWLRTGPDINGHFELVVPGRPFYLEVSAAGYRPWTFDRSGLNRANEVLEVKPESTRELVVLLEKEQ